MPQTGLIENAHNDLVTDAAYDFYGLRLATCSLDQRFVSIRSTFALTRNELSLRIKVWQLDERQGIWNVEDDWKVRPGLYVLELIVTSNLQAHDAAITKVSWAHPEFGTILASSSFDRTVKVWEQTSYTDPEPQMNGASGSSTASRWVERTVLVDAKGTVRAVEFAPHHFGLKLVR